jgi:hypothetical protein
MDFHNGLATIVFWFVLLCIYHMTKKSGLRKLWGIIRLLKVNNQCKHDIIEIFKNLNNGLNISYLELEKMF